MSNNGLEFEVYFLTEIFDCWKNIDVIYEGTLLLGFFGISTWISGLKWLRLWFWVPLLTAKIFHFKSNFFPFPNCQYSDNLHSHSKNQLAIKFQTKTWEREQPSHSKKSNITAWKFAIYCKSQQIITLFKKRITKTNWFWWMYDQVIIFPFAKVCYLHT